MNEENLRILANYYADKKCNAFSLAKQYHVNSKLSVELTEESIIQASPLVMNKNFSRTIIQFIRIKAHKMFFHEIPGNQCMKLL